MRAVTGVLIAVVVAAAVVAVARRGAFAGSPGAVAPAEAEVEVYSVAQQALVRVPTVRKTEEEWRRELAPLVFQVTRQRDTEMAFTGKLHAEKREGIYGCACCGTDLFTSRAKFDSGTGWPSFDAPVHPANVGEESDRAYGMVRTEVHCRRCGAHLGHVFDDGPAPTGLRYCINSASLSFRAGAEPATGAPEQRRPRVERAP